MFDPINDLVVVIRSAGERTTVACKELVLQQVPQHQVHLVREFPFEAALRRCYEIGIESSAKWMMTLDADVLLKEGAVRSFLEEAEKLSEQYFQVEGLLHDKLSCQYRKVGHRMYRTQYLEKAIQCLPMPREAIRPEFTTLQRMEQLGYLSKEITIVFGVHDYEQFLNDIYRKAFVHAQKHSGWVPRLIEQWRELAERDNDYKIALRGLYDGLMTSSRASIDKRDFTDLAKVALQDLGLSEKPELTIEMDNYTYVVQAAIMKASLLSETRFSLSSNSEKSGWRQRLAAKYAQLGPLKLGLYSLGVAFSRIGYLLKREAQV